MSWKVFLSHLVGSFGFIFILLVIGFVGGVELETLSVTKGYLLSGLAFILAVLCFKISGFIGVDN